MSASEEAVEAAYAVLDRHGMVWHYSCESDEPGTCLQRRHELARVREAVEAALAVEPIVPELRPTRARPLDGHAINERLYGRGP